MKIFRYLKRLIASLVVGIILFTPAFAASGPNQKLNHSTDMASLNYFRTSAVKVVKADPAPAIEVTQANSNFFAVLGGRLSGACEGAVLGKTNFIQGSSGFGLNQSANCFSLVGIAGPKALAQVQIGSAVFQNTKVIVVEPAKIIAFNFLPAASSTKASAALLSFYGFAFFVVLSFSKKVKVRVLGGRTGNFLNLRPLSLIQLQVFRC